MESQPMKQDELGRYVCVAHGGCLHSPHRTITSDGVWVRVRDSLGTHTYSSAHRDCFDAWQAREAQAGQDFTGYGADGRPMYANTAGGPQCTSCRRMHGAHDDGCANA